MKIHRLHIRITIEEKILIENRAKKSGLSISDFVRKVALKSEPKFLTLEDRKMFDELRVELRNTANLRNQNPVLRPSLDPIRKKLRELLNRFQ